MILRIQHVSLCSILQFHTVTVYLATGSLYGGNSLPARMQFLLYYLVKIHHISLVGS